MPEWFGGAFRAILDGMDPLVIIVLVLLAVVTKELRELVKLQAITNVKLDDLQTELRAHGRHQTARMEEIRKFMLSWWERFGPRVQGGETE